VTVCDPRLPIGIDRLWIDGLQVGECCIDLAIERHGTRITVTSSDPRRLVVRQSASR
jgi:hypothetical protein